MSTRPDCFALSLPSYYQTLMPQVLLRTMKIKALYTSQQLFVDYMRIHVKRLEKLFVRKLHLLVVTI